MEDLVFCILMTVGEGAELLKVLRARVLGWSKGARSVERAARAEVFDGEGVVERTGRHGARDGETSIAVRRERAEASEGRSTRFHCGGAERLPAGTKQEGGDE